MRPSARLGFIGLGTMGQDLLKAAVSCPKVEVLALSDPSEAALAAARKLISSNIRSFSDYRDLLNLEDLQGVVIAAPQHVHAEIAVAAMEHGYTTFCEKPMALNVIQCRRMIDAATKAGKELMIGQVLRYIAPYRYILERIESGDFGKPLAMRTIRTMGKWGSWGRPWRMNRSTTGGTLLEVNVHEVDLMLCILGEATSVRALGDHFIHDEVDYEDFVTFQVTFTNGTIGTCTSASCDFLGRNSGEIFLENGTIYYDSVSSTVRVGCEGDDPEVILYSEIHPEWEDGVSREIREFAETCLGEHPATIPGEDGLRAVEIGEAAYLSIRTGHTVTLPLPRK